MHILVKHSSTSVIFRVKLRSSATGQGLTGLTHSSTGLIISTICDNEATATSYTAAGSTIESITTLGTYATPTATKCRFKEVDATNHKGLYEVQLDDARYSVANAKRIRIDFTGATNLLDKDVTIQLTKFDPDDAIRGGFTALPNANAEAAGGLFTRGSGTGQINQSANGQIDVNAERLNNIAQSLIDLKDFADTGYDPATHKVAGVVLTDTTTTLTNLPSIPANWITASGITDGAFTAAKFASGAFDAVWTVTTRTITSLPAITANWLTASGIADGAFTSAKFASGAFDAVWTVATRTITSLPAITAGWLTSTGIADGAITAAKFGAGALDSVWSTGTRTLTGFGTLAADTATAVWSTGTRTLTSFGTLAADIWNAAPIDFTALSAAVNSIGTIVTTINSKIGSFTGSGINTILGFFQALMRNDVSVPSDVGGTYDDADHSLQALATDIAAINVSGGTGARVVTITVNDGTSPLENAKVRAYLSASENYVLSSNASGVVTFNLDDGTWTISITKPGYSFTSQLLVVNGNESQTYSMTQEVVTPNPDPDKSTVTITCYDAKTNVEADVKIYLEQMTIPTSSENIAFSGAAQEYISGVNGQIELTLWRNAKYRYRRGQEKDWIEFTPNAATYDVTSIVGY